jgi:hypothetical protein
MGCDPDAAADIPEHRVYYPATLPFLLPLQRQRTQQPILARNRRGPREERYEISGKTTQFRVIERIVDGEHPGTVVRRLPDEKIELLIPDQAGGWLEMRDSGKSNWRKLVQTEPDD